MVKERPVVLITGASRGIGAASARLAARRGYDVAIHYQRDLAAVEAVAASCRQSGATAAIIQGDIAKPAEIEAVFAGCDRAFGRLDVFLNNAGITGRAGRLVDAAAEDIKAVIDLNVTGAILAARLAVKRLSNRSGGHGGVIINMSSIASRIGSPHDFVWYAASKAAIDALTLGMAKEVAAEGIRVNAVAPGLIATDIHASAGMPDRLHKLGPTVPIGREGTAEEVASTILFLMSAEASYITGAVLEVSGGR